MNLTNVFRLGAAVTLLNGLMSLFATEMFFEMAGFEMTDSLITIGEFMGVTFLFLAIIQCKTADLAGSALADFGKVFALGQLMWAAIIGWHMIDGQAEGATAYGNFGITVVLGGLYFMYSRK